MNVEINLLSECYDVRRLNRSDVDLIYEMNSQNELFYQYHPPFVTRASILADMAALPPQKSLKDKYYLGFFQENSLVANMDLVLAYPEEEIAFIGFFMMNVQYQNKGIGSKIIKETCSCLKTLGFKKVRLGVDKGNPQSYAFWTKNQFSIIRDAEYLLMELVL